MRLPATLALVLRRAGANPAPVVSVAVNVLVVCTLVAGLAASLTLLQREALASALAVAPAEDTVLAASAPYDADDPAGQDAAVRAVLDPVVGVAGGIVVGLSGSGTYDLLGPAAGRDPGRTFATVDGAEDRLDVTEGRLPADSSGPLEVVVPASGDLAVGDELRLVGRADERRVEAVVVGRWGLPPGTERWLSGLDPEALLVAPERFADVAGTGTAARWRAVPDLEALGPDQLAPLVDEVVAASAELEAVGEELSTTVQAETGLVESLSTRARELTVLRALLVPAGLLVLVAAAGLVLVAAGLAVVRRDDEALLRSRGAGHWQLTGPTTTETLLLCGAGAVVAPLLASAVVRIGDVRPPLTLSAWVASTAAAAACALALSVPVAVRAVTGDRGQQLSVERQRRRTLTVLLATVLLVAALGVLAVVELRAFGGSVESATTTSTVDPLLVASPALLMLAVAVLVALLGLPPLFRLLARLVGSRGVPLALGSRFAARAVSRTVPLALAVTLASGTLAFAAVERSSSEAARSERASYVAGPDVRVTAPPDAQRAGVEAEREALAAVTGVESVSPVDRDSLFVDDLPADALLADLSATDPADLVGDADVDLSPLADGTGDTVPVAVTEDLADDASLDVGDTVTLSVFGVPTGLEVAVVLPALRTVTDGSGGILMDARAAGPVVRAAEEPDEWWLTVASGREDDVADAVRERPDLAADVLTRDDVLRRLDDDPSTGGAALAQVLVLTAAGTLVVGTLLLVSVVLLRRRERADQARMLGAAGGDRRSLTGVLAWEHAFVTGAGVVVGVLAGTAVAAVTLVSMTLGPDGRLLQPEPQLVVPWLPLLLPPLVMVTLPLLALVWLVRRDHGPGLSAPDTGGGR
ncbi:FtsX-like permease family protein [Nocardioides euryhalodurans]|uniref:FtsX-like permease family protein n=1 Tax=Nocardioides euryhalodurans TaxID=2518370 RepID=A0A4P7GMI1_9ACTN|nr:FtsX-like permease family protein [Nocardioides euryhalodurans]QBR93223.1 FtsX-like permease family protein [Nocardioides euryhalodurans]